MTLKAPIKHIHHELTMDLHHYMPTVDGKSATGHYETLCNDDLGVLFLWGTIEVSFRIPNDEIVSAYKSLHWGYKEPLREKCYHHCMHHLGKHNNLKRES